MAHTPRRDGQTADGSGFTADDIEDRAFTSRQKITVHDAQRLGSMVTNAQMWHPPAATGGS
jgi:hypothetical protein